MIRSISLTRLITRLFFLVPFAAIILTASAASAQLLGSAQNFAVLGASTVTNTGATEITGNVGVSPGTALTGFLPSPPNVIAGPGTVTFLNPGADVDGTIYAGGAVAARAHGDAGVAYARLEGLECPPNPGGNNLTDQILGTGVSSLPPGVYCFNSSAQLTGTLYLTGKGPWIFQIGSTLTTASNSRIVVAGQNCSGSNVFWQVGSSATLGTGTEFAGNILAHTSITVTKGVSVSGSVIALAGAVTMDTNNISVCRSGSGGLPPDLDKCEPHDRDHGNGKGRDKRGHDDDDHDDHDDGKGRDKRGHDNDDDDDHGNGKRGK